MLEEKIDTLIGAVQELTAAIKGQGGKPAATTAKDKPAATGKGKAADKAKDKAKAEPEGEAAEVTYDTVKSKLLELSKSQGRDAVVDVVQRFGCNSAKDINADRYAEVVQMVDELLNDTRAAA